MTALSRLRGTVVIDEVQRRPISSPCCGCSWTGGLCPLRFLVLGSASPDLLRQSAESLAGRLEVVPLSGFSLGEVGARSLDRLWLRGGFPPSYLARSRAGGDRVTPGVACSNRRSPSRAVRDPRSFGAGGMGTVYRAWDPRLARDVAIRVITTVGEPSAERLRRFEDEARAVARVEVALELTPAENRLPPQPGRVDALHERHGLQAVSMIRAMPVVMRVQ